MSEAENNSFVYKPESNYDQQIIEQQELIDKQIASTQPLIGDIEDISCLCTEYANDQLFLQRINNLERKYSQLRRTRGDGNCFYRAFGFSYFQLLLKDKQEYDRFFKYVQQSKEELVKLGFPSFTIEDFQENFLEALEKIKDTKEINEVLTIYNDQGYSDYLVVFLRLLVSGHLQKKSDFFLNFIEGDLSMKDFCNKEVEPMGKESDHIHIIALTAAVGVPIAVEYMDRGKDYTCHNFPEDSDPKLFLLYRPGHYDILYLK